MTERDKNYWIEQAKERLLANEKRADKGVTDMFFLYEQAAAELETEVTSMFGKYATDNGLTYAEASKLLSGKEYSVWKKSIQEYIQEAPKDAKNSRTMLELNTLSMKSRISRKEKMLADIYQTMIQLAQDENVKLSDFLQDTVKVNYYEGCFRMQRGFGIGFNVAKINDNLVRQILNYPWSEKHFSEAVWGHVDHIAAVARAQISLGFVKGSSVQEISKNIRQIMDSGKYATERLVRTECKYFANQGELAAYKENGIQKYRFIGGSEGSTGSCGCEALNGQVFNVEDAVAGVNFPPIHPNCLCTVVATFDKSLFSSKTEVNPLSENARFADWKKKYAKGA